MNYRIFLIANMLFALGTGISAPYWVIRVNEIVGIKYFGIAFGISILSQSLGALLVGRYVTKHLNAVIFTQFIFAGVVLLFSTNLSFNSVMVLEVIIGILMAVQVVCVPILIAEMSEKNNLGKRYGYFHSLDGIAVGLAMVVGSSISVIFGVNSMFFLGALFIFCSALLLWLASLQKTKLNSSQEMVDAKIQSK
ncbi:MAG: MFS transporter [Patescibacteria group bacterium]